MARTYENLDGPVRVKRVAELLKWQLGLGPGGKRRSPARASVPFVPNDGALLREAARPALTWVGHATFLVQLGGVSVLTDPVLFERIFGGIRRNVPPGLVPEALPPRVDVVVVTHNHYDHMDAPSLRHLGARGSRFVVPRGLGRWFAEQKLPCTELDWWQTERVEGLDVTLVPAEHWSRRTPWDTNKSHWGGYVLEAGGRRVYHAGDTAHFRGFRLIGERCGPLDAAMLPIGAYEPRWFMRPQHMDPRDALDAFDALGARRFVAMHWGTFKLTDEPLDEPPALLRALWQERGHAPERLCIPAVGETLWL